MQQVNRPELVLGNAVWAPEIIDLCLGGGIVMPPFALVPSKYTIDLLLGEHPFAGHVLLSGGVRGNSVQRSPSTYNGVLQSFFVKTFGCRASQADGAALEAGLAGGGLRAAEDLSQADLVVLNTCTVTASADDEVRQVVRKLHRDRPSTKILVTGCYAQRAPEELAALPGVEWVVGNSHKTFIQEMFYGGTPYHSQIHVGEIGKDFLAAPVEDALGDRVRPNLKVQDGCANKCSFCIIPSVRGRSRSAEADNVVAQVRDLATRYREVVLSGINLGRWGRDLPGRARLVDLVRRLLDETSVERLRLSSVEPMDFSDALLALMAESGRIAQHVHAPLQSGSDTVLRRMHRKYRPRHYADRILKARALMPQCAVGADVMTGFPGETDAEFEDSRAFIDSLPFTYLHVFTYSARPGTPAAEAPGQVPMAVRKQRTKVLRELGEAKSREFRTSFIGQRVSLVTLESGRFGISENYLKVAYAQPRVPNQIEEVSIGGLTADGVFEAGSLPVLA
jgi:threonylcarbamoyladenosine tRNA methylthiotransferase MtaB